MVSPHHFLTPEPLHEWHKRFWDHKVKWAINIVGAEELDFRFAVLQPSVGFRQFGEGMSHLNKVTGRMQRDIQRYLVAVIAGAAPPGVVLSICSLLNFSYLAQAPELNDDDCTKLLLLLCTFHENKAHVINAGGRRGKKDVITNWYIPKLELLQNVIPSIRNSGVPSQQWSADVTEHAHILMIKNPAQWSNMLDMDPQICRYLDRLEKCSKFKLATCLRENEQGAQGCIGDINDGGNSDDNVSDDLDADITQDVCLFQSVAKLGQPKRSPANYFTNLAQDLSTLLHIPARVPFPPRTFIAGNTAINLARDPLNNV